MRGSGITDEQQQSRPWSRGHIPRRIRARDARGDLGGRGAAGRQRRQVRWPARSSGGGAVGRRAGLADAGVGARGADAGRRRRAQTARVVADGA